MNILLAFGIFTLGYIVGVFTGIYFFRDEIFPKKINDSHWKSGSFSLKDLKKIK